MQLPVCAMTEQPEGRTEPARVQVPVREVEV